MAENFLDGTGPKPVSWWMFEDASSPSVDGNTATGNDLGWFNGTPVQDGTATKKVQGTYSISCPTSADQALRSRANLNANTPFKAATTDFTFGYWCYLKGNATGGNGMVYNDGTSGFRIATIATGKFRVVLTGATGTGNDFSSDTTIAADGLHHVVVRWQGSTDDELSMWVDGVKQSTTGSISAVALTASGNLTFVGNVSGITNFDEAFMFAEALTDSQIQSIYAHGLAGDRNTALYARLSR